MVNDFETVRKNTNGMIGVEAAIDRIEAENKRLESEVEDLKVSMFVAGDEIVRLRALLNKDPDVDWQEMAKILFEKEQDIERLRTEKEELLRGLG